MKKFPVLISYAYARKMKSWELERFLRNPDIQVLLDSGAFTALSSGAPIDVRDYIAFLRDWAPLFSAYMALDVIGKPRPTRKNLYRMWNAGLSPIPIHVFGEDEEWFDKLYERSDLVAFAPRQKPRDHHSFVLKVLKLKMKWAKGRKVHWFGYTPFKSIEQYHPFSCDSSSWNRGSKYGWLYVYLGKGRWIEHINYRMLRARRYPRELVNAVGRYGFSEEDLYNEQLWRSKGIPRERFLIHVINMRSWVDYCRDVRKHLGTQIFLAMSPSEAASKELLDVIHGVEGR